MSVEEVLRKSTANPYLLLSLCKAVLYAENKGDVKDAVDRALEILIPDSQPKIMDRNELIKALDNADTPSLWSDTTKEGMNADFWLLVIKQSEEIPFVVVTQGEEDYQDTLTFASERNLLSSIETIIEKKYKE